MTKLNLLLLALGGLAVTACNTVEGAGRDIERAGQGIQDQTDDDEDYNSRY